MNTGIIYMYTSPSNKVYIGQTTRPEKRIVEHKISRENNYFHNAIKKYGFDNFKYDILHTAIDETKEGLKEKLDFWERFYISEYKSNDSRYGYNLTVGGGGVLGFQHTCEAKKKISESHKGRPTWNKGKPYPHSEETRIKLSESHKGKQFTEEHKRNLSESLKGKTTWIKGKHHSEETRIKLSESHKGISYPKRLWLTETGEIVEMCKNIVIRFHPNWIQIN